MHDNSAATCVYIAVAYRWLVIINVNCQDRPKKSELNNELCNVNVASVCLLFGCVWLKERRKKNILAKHCHFLVKNVTTENAKLTFTRSVWKSQKLPEHAQHGDDYLNGLLCLTLSVFVLLTWMCRIFHFCRTEALSPALAQFPKIRCDPKRKNGESGSLNVKVEFIQYRITFLQSNRPRGHLQPDRNHLTWTYLDRLFQFIPTCN